MTCDFPRNHLAHMIDSRHLLAVLANRIPWKEVEASCAMRRARRVMAGKKVEDPDLIGPNLLTTNGGISSAGRPRLPYLGARSYCPRQHAFKESDGDVTQRCGMAPALQHSSE